MGGGAESQVAQSRVAQDGGSCALGAKAEPSRTWVVDWQQRLEQRAQPQRSGGVGEDVVVVVWSGTIWWWPPVAGSPGSCCER